MRKTKLIMAVVALLSGATAVAQENVIEGLLEACEADVEAYCSQVTPGEGRLLACAYAHEDKLSGRCQYALYDAAAQLEQFAAALTHLARECRDDLLEHCGAVELGEGRVGTCLLEHEGEVSAACRKAMDDTELEPASD